jgi:signal transduction histidine kinase
MIVLAFVIPLGLLIRDQARDRALNDSQVKVESVATALAVTSTDGPVSVEQAELIIGALGDETITVFLPDGARAGRAADATDNVLRAQNGAAFSASIEGGAEILVPVAIARGEAVVVRGFVPTSELRHGVTAAWGLLALLGVAVTAVAMMVANRLASSITRPVEALSSTAHDMADGLLDARVTPAGPPEIVEMGEAFNYLGSRLEGLLAAERESVADLSHRLRTPLTALRLQAESVPDSTNRTALLADIDALARAIDGLIEQARRPTAEADDLRSDITAVLRHRLQFWTVLAEDQGRQLQVRIPTESLWVAVTGSELGAAIDVLVENVLAHTPPGTALAALLESRSNDVTLTIEDEGTGFPDLDVTQRGASGRGSTGLGLDIVRQVATRAGGNMSVANRPRGGARVKLILPMIEGPD